MARTNIKGRKIGDSKHVRLQEWLLSSPAYRWNLSNVARCLLVELYRKYNGTNNGKLFLSCRDAAELLSVSKDTAARGFRDLEERGFIKPASKSAFSVKARIATTWTLTEFPLGDALPTKDFMRWRPGPEETKDGTTTGTDCLTTGTARLTTGTEGSDLSLRSDRGGRNRPRHGTTTGTQVVYQGGERSDARPSALSRVPRTAQSSPAAQPGTSGGGSSASGHPAEQASKQPQKKLAPRSSSNSGEAA